MIRSTLIRFAGWYVLLLVVALLILELLGVGRNSGVNIGIVLGATLLACHGFIKRNGRVFTSSERKRALWGMWAVDLSLQAVFTLLLLPSAGVDALAVLAVVFVAIGIVHLGVIYLGIVLSGLSRSL